MMTAFTISCYLVALACLYQVVANCYRTGFLGALGLSLVGLMAGAFAMDITFNQDKAYEVLPQTMWLMIGLVLYFVQKIWRIIYFNKIVAPRSKVTQSSSGEKLA